MEFKYESLDKVKDIIKTEYLKDDILFVKLTIFFDELISPKPMTIRWLEHIVDVAGIWAPCFKDNELRANWGKRGIESQLARYMPQFTYYSANGNNRYTICLDDVKNLIGMESGIIEENGLFEMEIKLFNTPLKPIDKYELLIRIDRRDIKYFDSIKDCKKWWESLGYKPCNVPKSAFDPVYSSWYNFHQNLDQDKLFEEIKLASMLGFKTLIIDDGWQCDDNNRGYAYTGDWQVTNNKFYDLKKFVSDCHNLGVKVMVWYSVPFIGRLANIVEKFKGKYLAFLDWCDAYALDPRFKEVRDYLINLYKDALIKWDLDGFKLDFIDAFYLYEQSSKEYKKMDIVVLEDAVDKLLKDIYIELSKIKSDVLIEYRQAYVGPLVVSYGNMLRVGDCPYSANTNKREIVNLRLTSGITSVHTDMIMWHKDNPGYDCYRQLYASLFSVPQISVLLKDLKGEHYQIIKNYLNYYNENKEVLFEGVFTASTPDNGYAWAKSSYKNKDIIALYNMNSYKIDNDITDIIYLASNKHIYLEFDLKVEVNVIDYLGNNILNNSFEKGIIRLDIPDSCRINIKKI